MLGRGDIPGFKTKNNLNPRISNLRGFFRLTKAVITTGFQLAELHNCKFICNERGILFFVHQVQHSSAGTPEISYQDDYKGNALAGTFSRERIDIRFHSAFTDDQVQGLWLDLLKQPELNFLKGVPVYYQGRLLSKL